MRMLVQVATIHVLLAGAASAAPRSITFRGVQFDLEARQPLELAEEANGIVVRAPNMPPIWFGVYGEACVRNDRKTDLARPDGFFPANGPPAVSPWLQRASRDALCIEGDSVTLHVLVQDFDPVSEPLASGHVYSVLSSIAKSVRPPIEIAPDVHFDRTSLEAILKRGGRPNELLYEGWIFEISLDAASCLLLSSPPRGTRRECRELPDRAVVVTYREAPTAGAPPPPEGTPPPPEGAAAPPDAAPAPPDAAPAPAPTPPDLDLVAKRLADRIEGKYGATSWVDGNFTPKWGGRELPLQKLPSGTWKLSDRGDTFELHEIRSRSRILVSRSACSMFWASRPAGRRIEAPSFLPADARSAMVDERERWVSTSCFGLLGSEVEVTIDLPSAPDEATARALRQTLTEARNSFRSMISIGLLAGSGSFGVSLEAWYVKQVSGIAQLELIDARSDGTDELEAFRLAIGLGVGLSRPHLRLGIHGGFGIESAPLKQRGDEDHTGASMFFDGRAMASLGPLMAQAIVRGAVYIDADCTKSQDRDTLCGESDDSDFVPKTGWEVEGRIGIAPRRSGQRFGLYGGVRYLATRTDTRVDQGLLVTIGGGAW